MNTTDFQYLFFGDSITYGTGSSRQGWADLFLQEFSSARIYNLGIPGENSSELRQRIISETQARKHARRKSIITIACGTNDLRFYTDTQTHHIDLDTFTDNLRSMVRDLIPITEKIFLLTPPPIIEDIINDIYPGQTYFNDTLEKYIDSMKKVAQEFDVQVIDLYHSLIPNIQEYLSEDGLHPNQQGYQKMYTIIQTAIQKDFERL